MSTAAGPTASMIIIGDEILSGKVQEQNLTCLAGTLRGLGITLERVVVVRDRVEVIAGEIRGASKAYEHVFTSGGIGPTHDDVTIDAAALAFERGVTTSPELESLLRGYHKERLLPAHLLMARIPEGARLVRAPDVPWPTTVIENVWVLPGIPEVFRMKMRTVEHVLPRSAGFVSVFVNLHLDEGQLKDRLDAVVGEFGDIQIGSYPRWIGAPYKTRITFDGTDAVRVNAARDKLVSMFGPADLAPET